MTDLKEHAKSFAAYIGLDWADKKHNWTMQTADGKRSRGELIHTPEAIDAWAAELAQRFGGRPVAITLEQARGALIATLSKYGHLHLFIVDPSRLNYYRKSVSPSGAKSDLVDGDLILDFQLKHPELVRYLAPDTVETRSLQFLTEQRRAVVNQHTRQVQILTHWLKQVFPQILAWFDDVSTPLVGDLLKRWPDLVKLKKARPETLLQFLHDHNCRSAERNQQRLNELRTAVAATHDSALWKTANLMIATTIEMLATLRTSIEQFNDQIQEVYEIHPDRFLMESLPGAGKALEPRLIAAMGTDRDRFRSAGDMACCFGIAPVTESSGNSRWVHWRWQCSKFIRQTFHEWGACTVRKEGRARDHYERQRAKGKSHHAAVRSVAFKWIRILYRCWRDRVPYSEQRYLEALARAAGKGKPAVNPAESSVSLPAVQWKTCGGFSKPTKLSS
uniref:Transposase IS116/IS110/IS902 family protein n=1 Tax=Solibacter usitatus (strain Ellin6076) TaxID=234267 RepID=Q025Y1_SOLUE